MNNNNNKLENIKSILKQPYKPNINDTKHTVNKIMSDTQITNKIKPYLNNKVGLINKMNSVAHIGTSNEYIPIPTDNLSETEIINLLSDYVKVEPADYNKLQLGMHVRYFKKVVVNGLNKLAFRLGGEIVYAKGIPEYIIIKNLINSWSINLNNVILFRKITNNELRVEYCRELINLSNKLEASTYKIRELTRQNKLLLNENDKLEQENKKLLKQLQHK